MSLPIVMLAGTLCDEQLWHKVVSELGPNQTVICRSLGAYPDWDSELANLVKDLPKEFVLVGFSLGGIAALAVLEQYPERVKRLVLVASTALADPVESQTRRHELLNLAKQNQDFKQLALMQISPCDRQNIGEADVEFAVEMAQRFTVEQYACQTELACSRRDTRDVLSRSDIDVDLVYGINDSACGEDKQLIIKQACPRAALYPIQNAGHWLPLSHPHTIANLIDSTRGLGQV